MIDWLIGNKLTLRRVIIFKSLCKRPAKHDIFTADIYYYMYIMTEFSYTKCDFSLAAYGGVVLQQFEFITIYMGKNRHFWQFPMVMCCFCFVQNPPMSPSWYIVATCKQKINWTLWLSRSIIDHNHNLS